MERRGKRGKSLREDSFSRKLSRIHWSLAFPRGRGNRGIHGYRFVSLPNILGQGEAATREGGRKASRRDYFSPRRVEAARSTDISTYLNVATGNACAGQSNEKPVPFVTRNPTSFTDGNCGLLLEAGSKNRTRDGGTEVVVQRGGYEECL